MAALLLAGVLHALARSRLVRGERLALAHPIALEDLSSMESTLMMDVLFFGLSVALFSLTWGLVRLCDRV